MTGDIEVQVQVDPPPAPPRIAIAIGIMVSLEEQAYIDRVRHESYELAVARGHVRRWSR